MVDLHLSDGELDEMLNGIPVAPGSPEPTEDLPPEVLAHPGEDRDDLDSQEDPRELDTDDDEDESWIDALFDDEPPRRAGRGLSYPVASLLPVTRCGSQSPSRGRVLAWLPGPHGLRPPYLGAPSIGLPPEPTSVVSPWGHRGSRCEWLGRCATPPVAEVHARF